MGSYYILSVCYKLSYFPVNWFLRQVLHHLMNKAALVSNRFVTFFYTLGWLGGQFVSLLPSCVF
jgi:hypothetical protein